MAESSRCLKYGGVTETVPRHECTPTFCEFDFPTMIEGDIEFLKQNGLPSLAEYAERKLKFSQERAGKA